MVAGRKQGLLVRGPYQTSLKTLILSLGYLLFGGLCRRVTKLLL
jgi:hypothetical protein